MPSRFRGFKIKGKDAQHLKSVLRTQVTQLIQHERIETTLPKAKLLKRFADKMVTLAKKGTKNHYNQACSFVRDRKVVDKLFGEFAERYRARDGGYTRVLRTRKRQGDDAQLAYIEYIDREGEIRAPRPPKTEAEKQALRERLKNELSGSTMPIVEGVVPEMGEIPDEVLIEQEASYEEADGIEQADDHVEAAEEIEGNEETRKD